ncbi:MAG: winged helix-turn-helix domain-containing protein, partial [Candidatus Marinimicrobia bacterium]|nr:winged helix-turn-helix domain-containing protein [Candidatus Neomarinimicrobiota bacterium]
GTGTTTQETTQDTTQESTQENIVVLLKAKPTITRKELADKIGLTTDGIKYHIDKMRAAGIIKRVGSRKAGQWEVLK